MRTKIKLSPDQIKKISLSLIGLVALVYCYLSFLLGPLQASQARMRATTAELEANLAQSKKAVLQATQMEQSAALSVARLKSLEARIPTGAPLAWFPPRMKQFFAGDGLVLDSVRLLNSVALEQPELNHFARYEWSVALEHADFLALGKSLARLENEEPLLAIYNLNIRFSADHPETQSATLSAAIILKN